MKDLYDLHDIWGVLFVFSIENTRDEERERIIASKNVNDDEELGQLFDLLIRPEFLIYSQGEQVLLIDTLDYFLGVNDSFDRVFLNLDTYFDEDVKDQRRFMKILLGCLRRYHSEAAPSS